VGQKGKKGVFEMRKNQQGQKGFTIIELVVVIVILGILAAVAFPKFENLSGSATTAVLNGGKAAILSAGVIQYAKTQGANSTASIIAATTLDGMTATDGGGCNVVLTLSGGGTTSFVISSDYCSG
jgi:prepilin-type N-terminal cleavage/methylation domain-containing protein